MVAVALNEVDEKCKGITEEELLVYETRSRLEAAILGLGHRVEDLVLLIVAGVLVVLAVRYSPGVERHENW